MSQTVAEAIHEQTVGASIAWGDADLSGYQKGLADCAERLGGHERTGLALAHEFSDSLRKAIAQNRGVNQYEVPHLTFWLQAEAQDFRLAMRHLDSMLNVKRLGNQKPLAQAPWQGAMLTLREDLTLHFERDGLFIQAARAGFTRMIPHRISSEPGKEQWTIHITDDGKRLINGDSTYMAGNAPSITYASSEDGARKALVRMVKAFFGVALTPVS